MHISSGGGKVGESTLKCSGKPQKVIKLFCQLARPGHLTALKLLQLLSKIFFGQKLI